MENKGINTIIEETKSELTSFITSKLKLGIPIGIINLIIDNMSMEIKNGLKVAIEQESKKIEEKKEVESKQVKYEPEDLDQ